MEFPFGHHSHHHHRRDDDEDERREYYPPPDSAPPPPAPYLTDDQYAPPPPPPYYQETPYPPPPFSRPHYEENEYARPPPPGIQETHVYHTSHNQELDSPLDYPPPIQVTHVSHERIEDESETHHSFRPHLPSFIQQHIHHSGTAPGLDLSNKPTYKVYSKADPNYHLTIREGKVILARTDPSDDFQNWYKDEKYSTRVKDEEGFPCFALVNKATGQAMKHSIGDTHPVQLVPYNPDVLDESILWTEGRDLGDGFRAVRMVNNIHLNVDAFHGDKHSGGVRDGTIIVLWKWNKGDNQRWRITPHCKFPQLLKYKELQIL